MKIFSTAVHKPHLVVLSQHPNHYYNRKAIVDSTLTGALLWTTDPATPNRIENLTVKQALICLKTYQDWWNNLKKMEGVV